MRAEVLEDGDRGIEFLDLKNKIEAYVRATYHMKDIQDTSCEKIANDLLDTFKLSRVSVSEDGENGVTITRYTDKEHLN